MHTYIYDGEYVYKVTDASNRTPGLHNKIPAYKIFARGWVAQKSICYTINAKKSNYCRVNKGHGHS